MSPTWALSRTAGRPPPAATTLLFGSSWVTMEVLLATMRSRARSRVRLQVRRSGRQLRERARRRIALESSRRECVWDSGVQTTDESRSYSYAPFTCMLSGFVLPRQTRKTHLANRGRGGHAMRRLGPANYSGQQPRLKLRTAHAYYLEGRTSSAVRI